MSRRFAHVAVALLAIALLLCSDLFKTNARRPGTPAPAHRARRAQTTTPAAPAPTKQPTAAPRQAADDEPLVVRVGVVNYNGTRETHFNYQQVFSRMAASHADRKLDFRLVDGAYDDVLEWYKSGLLNVAVLSPGVIAELSTLDKWKGELKDYYFATEGLPPAKATNLFASAARRKPGAHFSYHSVCLVRADSKVRTAADIKELAEKHEIEFVFVHPLSVSGYVLPEYVLREKYGVKTNEIAPVWSYDHTQSLRELAEGEADDTARVAFVKDDADAPGEGMAAVEFMKKFRQIHIPELDGDEGLIPQDVVLIHPNFVEHKPLIDELFKSYGDAVVRGGAPTEDGESLWKAYAPRKDWQDSFARVVGWLHLVDGQVDARAQQYLTLEQIVGKLRNYKRSNSQPPRLALVLSGGGAKCAYQLGAIQAIEDELDSHRDAEDKRDIDISLVVGTSGGAINALFVALGLTESSAGMGALKKTWENFNQTTFFEPWRPFTATIGLFIGLLQAIMITPGIRLFAPEKINWHRHAGKIALLMLLCAALLSATRLKAWAVVPALVLFVITCARLFANPTRAWWKHAGWAMLALALVEAAGALIPWEPLRHTEWLVAVALLSCQLIVIVVAVRIQNAFTTRWWQRSLAVFAAVTIVEAIMISRTDYWRRLALLGKDHVIHHLWLLLTIGSLWAVLSLAAVGGALLWIGYTHFPGWRPMGYNIIPSGRKMLAFRRTMLMRLSLTLASIVALQLSLSLFHNDSLSNSAGLQGAMSRQVPPLVQKEYGDLVVGGATDEARLSDLSRQIIERDLLRRDLVITSMMLPSPDGGAQPDAAGECERAAAITDTSDWYFYYDHSDAAQAADAAADKAADPHATAAAHVESSDRLIRKDARFRSLRCGEYSDKLMDVVIGSSSIFPVFQPRPLVASAPGGAATTRAELIDGGFAHNSPVEAAVRWGATHVILVEASPEERKGARSDYLLANSVSAFNYLFNQAQLTDARSRSEVEVFSLRPQSIHPREKGAGGEDLIRAADHNPCSDHYALADDGSPTVGANMCTFDFIDFFVRGAIDLGRSDASQQCFRRERAQPAL
jgi:predicted acylesterase/phospholipase RssA/ABC-type phosphate/phosphonate transport system substrate-binding protein